MQRYNIAHDRQADWQATARTPWRHEALVQHFRRSKRKSVGCVSKPTSSPR
jgi:hypothetical protein